MDGMPQLVKAKRKARDGVWPVCTCPDPWECVKRAPHRTWSYRISLPPIRTGERGRRPGGSGFPTRSAALIARRDAASDYGHGRQVHDGNRTVKDLLEWWLDQKRLRRPEYSPHTIANYEAGAELWTGLIGHVRLMDLKYSHINNSLVWLGRKKTNDERPKSGYYGKWKAQITVTTLRRHQNAIRNALNSALREGWVAKNVAAGPMAAIADETKTGGGTREDLKWGELVVDGIDIRWGPSQTIQFLNSIVGHKWEALYTQYVYTAARRSEWLGASWSHLIKGGLSIQWRCLVLRGKAKDADCPACGQSHHGLKLHPGTKSTNGWRWVPIPTQGRMHLEKHRIAQQAIRARAGEAWNDHHLIFCQDDGMPLHPNHVSDEFKRLVVAADLPMIKLHDLRHNAAGLFLNHGIPVETVALMTGHDVEVLRNVYNHMNPEIHGATFEEANAVISRYVGVNGKPDLRAAI
jgi:integrase